LPQQDIVVIAGSAGSFDALKAIVHELPADFSASIFVVVHMTADAPGYLPEQLSNWGKLRATQAIDEEKIQKGRIYVARPDFHLTLEPGRMRVLRGPRENRHRPAIDPLLRTAARVYGSRVIGVILSGRHDDGSAGLYAVKQRGGVAIVQEPTEVQWSEMPTRAIAYANPQYVLPGREIGRKLVDLVNLNQDENLMRSKKIRKNHQPSAQKSRPTATGLQGGSPEENLKAAYFDEGEGTPSVFACPECHGVLWELTDGDLVQFRCRVGHSYGSDSLMVELSESSEAALWAAMRALEEKSAMQRRVADSFSADQSTAKRLRDQSAADDANARIIRDIIFQRDAKLSHNDAVPDEERVA
jgi:two-component system chemotaxis response regulator CheB